MKMNTRHTDPVRRAVPRESESAAPVHRGADRTTETYFQSSLVRSKLTRPIFLETTGPIFPWLPFQKIFRWLKKVISFWKGEIQLHPRSILYASQDRDYDDSKSGLFLEEVKDIY
jgi:hypothetical protein